MRRSDREIKEMDQIIHVIENCDVCRLALNDNGYPYILPLNFGLQIEDNKIVLYFHGANDGTKYDLIVKDNRASFEMDCSHKLVTDASKGSCTMEYQSVIGKGLIEFVSDKRKKEALSILMKHYHKEKFQYNEEIIPQTTVFRLVVNKITGKVRMKKND